jgi:hypothetical protein
MTVAHWNELVQADGIKNAREWFERANSTDASLRAAALAVWAMRFGDKMVLHAEASSEWLQSFREAVAAKDMGELESLSQALNEWHPLGKEAGRGE